MAAWQSLSVYLPSVIEISNWWALSGYFGFLKVPGLTLVSRLDDDYIDDEDDSDGDDNYSQPLLALTMFPVLG